MEPKLKQEIADKVDGAKSFLIFLFNPDGGVQTCFNGDPGELMATIATEMQKSPIIKMVIQGANEMYKGNNS